MKLLVSPLLSTPRRLGTCLLALLMIAGLAWLSITSASARPSAGASPMAAKPTIVLVHGAWADASSWTPVIAGLQDDGYTVVAPPNTLRGVASDSGYLVDYLASISGPIVLVGHSYGGAVITNAARGNAMVKALVYVDAFIPKKGESVLQLVAQRPGSCLGGGGDPTKVFNFVSYPGAPPDDFDLYIKTQPDDPYPGFAACFANDLPAAQAAVLAATQRPFTLSGGSEPSGRPAWRQIPSWAVVGTDDQVLPPAEQLFMARRAGAHITKVDAGHLSMLSHPDDVVDVIESAVGSTS